jgi:hypothetical protein
MNVYPPPAFVDLRLSALGGQAPRRHPQAPHPPALVQEVRRLVETTTETYRAIAARTGVNPARSRAGPRSTAGSARPAPGR